VHRPSSVDELQKIVAASGRVRPLGTAHSFSPLADTEGDLVSVAGLPPTVEISADRRSVTVAAGVRYGELSARLHAEGLALHNLGSLPHISVAGACATGTHGSGVRNGNLATAVSAVEFVTADGRLVRLDRAGDADTFPGAVVALGALGVVTALTLDVLPAYEVVQHVYDDLSYEEFAAHPEEILSGGYSVSLFTDWAGPRFTQVWRKRRVDEPGAGGPGVDGPSASGPSAGGPGVGGPSASGPGAGRVESSWHGARLAGEPRHPIAGMPVENCTEQLGVAGPWYARLPHFRLEFTPSSGDELQSEYAVPRAAAVDALDAVRRLGDRIAPVLHVSEIRAVAADELWLSPNYRRDSLAIHFTWVADASAVTPVVAEVERALAPYDARPHWGKVFGVPPETVWRCYERLPDFVALATAYDPAGKFRNEMLDRYLPTVR
jgi:xylitol oxidase